MPLRCISWTEGRARRAFFLVQRAVHYWTGGGGRRKKPRVYMRNDEKFVRRPTERYNIEARAPVEIYPLPCFYFGFITRDSRRRGSFFFQGNKWFEIVLTNDGKPRETFGAGVTGLLTRPLYLVPEIYSVLKNTYKGPLGARSVPLTSGRKRRVTNLLAPRARASPTLQPSYAY